MAGKAEEKKKSNVAVLVAVFLMIILALVAAVVFLFKQNSDKDKMLSDASVSENVGSEKRNVVINKDNIEQIMEDLTEDDKVTPGNYEVVMSTEWNFQDGKSVSEDAYVENAVGNTNDVFFDIQLAETGETIYSSPLLPIGSHIESVALDKELPAGSYDCVMVYSLVDDEQNVLSKLQVAFIINVIE